MTRFSKTPWSMLVILCTLLLAGCQVMDSSVTYELQADGIATQKCKSGLGSYSLPMSTVNVKVLQDYIGGNPVGRARLAIDPPQQNADPRHLYCLDFLENPFSDDVVQVFYAGKGDTEAVRTTAPIANGLLSLITSRNTDRTGDIVRKLIRAIFIIASGNATSTFGRSTLDPTATTVTMTEQSVDPFDAAAMSSLNQSLREYGYCLSLGEYTYNSGRLDTGRILQQAGNLADRRRAIPAGESCGKAKIPRRQASERRFLSSAATLQALCLCQGRSRNRGPLGPAPDRHGEARKHIADPRVEGQSNHLRRIQDCARIRQRQPARRLHRQGQRDRRWHPDPARYCLRAGLAAQCDDIG